MMLIVFSNLPQSLSQGHGVRFSRKDFELGIDKLENIMISRLLNNGPVVYNFHIHIHFHEREGYS